MSEHLRARRGAWGVGVLSVLLLAGLLVAAVRSEGYEESRISLNSGSVWIVRGRGLGRLNLESRSIETIVGNASPDSDPIEVLQSGRHVTGFRSDSLRPVDDATATELDRVTVGGRAVVAVGGPSSDAADPAVVAVADAKVGRLWVASAEDWGAVGEKRRATLLIDDPDAELADEDDDASVDDVTTDEDDEDEEHAVGPVELAVGPDGIVHVHAEDRDEVLLVDVEGAVTRSTLERPVGDAPLTAVGSTTVLLDRDANELVTSKRTIDISSLGGRPVLQKPGPAWSSVLVATEDGLWDVPLDGGSADLLVGGGGSGPIEPVRITDSGVGCAYGAWGGPGTWGRWCGPDDDGATALDLPERIESPTDWWTEGPSTFQVNHGRVILNERSTGVSFLVDLPDPVLIADEDWKQADEPEPDEDDDETILENLSDECGEEVLAPEPEDLTVGARDGVPVIVPLVDRVKADPCDVVTIVDLDELDDVVGADVAVVGDGAELQVTPDPGRTEPITVPYTVEGNAGERVARTLTVNIHDESVNGEPDTEPDSTVVTIGSSAGVVHNVLLNDTDPDGDPLTLIGVEQDAERGKIRFRSNGEITYVPTDRSAVPAKLVYTVTDGRETAEETLTVEMRQPGPNQPPTPRPDRATAYVGRRTSIDVLANDSDPDGDELHLRELEGEHAEVNATADPDGTVTFDEPPTAGRFVLEAQVADEAGSVVNSTLVVTVLDPAESPGPIAVRDDVAVRPQVPALVDLMENDLHPEGRPLAVTSVDVDREDGVTVELLDMRIARVTARRDLEKPVVVRYTLSDGDPEHETEGVLLVRSHLESSVPQNPYARRDDATVRAGRVAAVPVLRNDVDPDGEELTITDVDLDEDLGTAFIQGDQLRIRPHSTTRDRMVVSYTVENPAGATASADVVVTVLAPDADNRAPSAPEVEGRVFSGRKTVIGIPFLDLDPDGDPVHLVGLDPTNLPRRGAARIADDGHLEYEAFEGERGTDEFGIIVSDGELETGGTARVVVSKRPRANRAPVATMDRARVVAGGERIVPVLDNDYDPDDEDELFLVPDGPEGLSQPMAGSVALTDDGRAVLFEAPSDIGSEPTTIPFTYGVSDGEAVSRGLVLVEVTPGDIEPEAPRALDDTMRPQLVGETVEIDVLDNDRAADDAGEALRIRVLDEDLGELRVRTLDGGRIEVELGTETAQFIYEITDSHGATAMALVTIPVVDELPIDLELLRHRVGAGETTEIDVAEAGPDDFELDEIFGATVRGVEAERGDGPTAVLVTAHDEASRSAGFAYRVRDDERSGIGFVNVTVEGELTEPDFEDPGIEVPAGGSRRVNLAKYVEDHDPEIHEFANLRTSRRGVVDAELTGSELRIEAGPDDGESVTLTLELGYGGGRSIDVDVTVTITETEIEEPTAVLVEAETDEGVAVRIPVLDHVHDPYGKGLTLVGEPELHGDAVPGSVRYEGDRVVYDPDMGAYGRAVVTYSARDELKRLVQGQIDVTVHGRPGRPHTPSGTVENGLVRLRWEAPDRGGRIDGYLVRVYRGDDRWKTEKVTSNSFEAGGLTNGQPYRFQVAALNRVVTAEADVRDDEWSERSEIFIPDAAPPAVQSLGVEFRRDQNAGGAGGVLHVRWRPPGPFEGSDITGYRVTMIRPQGGQEVRDLDLSDRRLTRDGGLLGTSFEGLQNGAVHSFTVQARNEAGANLGSPDAGLGVSSGPVSETPTGVPGSPGEISVGWRRADAQASRGHAEIGWGSANPNGDTPTYRVQARSGGGDWTDIAGAETGTSHLATGLEPSKRHRFRVRAENRAGESGWTEYARDFINSGKPTVSTSTVRPGDGRVVVKVKGSLGGQGSHEWRYRLNGSGSQPLGFAGAEGEAGVSNLTNGSTYTIHVRLCNTDMDSTLPDDDRCSDWTPARNGDGESVVPFGNPNLTVGVDNGEVRWTWHRPGAVQQTVTADGGVNDAPPGGFTGDRFDVAVLDVPDETTYSLTVEVRTPGGTPRTETVPITIGPRQIGWSGTPTVTVDEHGHKTATISARVTGLAGATGYWFIPFAQMTAGGAHTPGTPNCLVDDAVSFTSDGGGARTVSFVIGRLSDADDASVGVTGIVRTTRSCDGATQPQPPLIHPFGD